MNFGFCLFVGWLVFNCGLKQSQRMSLGGPEFVHQLSILEGKYCKSPYKILFLSFKKCKSLASVPSGPELNIMTIKTEQTGHGQGKGRRVDSAHQGLKFHLHAFLFLCRNLGWMWPMPT